MATGKKLDPKTLSLGTTIIGVLTWHIWFLENTDESKQRSAPFSGQEDMLRNCVEEFGMDLLNPAKITINAKPEDIENLKTEYYNIYAEGPLNHYCG